MGFFLSILPDLIRLLGALPSLVIEAEKAFGGAPGSGAAKKQLVMDTIAAGLQVAPAFGLTITPAQSSAVVSVASVLIDGAVAGLNAAQVFKQ